MKTKIIIMLIALFSVGGVDASAQKWLKVLGGIADAVLGDDSSSNSSTSSSSSSSSSRSSKSKKKSSTNASQDISVTLTDAVRYGTECVRVGFVMENTSKENHQVIIKATSVTYGGKEYYPVTINSGVNDFEFAYKSELEHLITFATQRIPAGAKVNGYFYFTGVPNNITSFEKISFKAYFQSSSDGGYSFPIDNAVGAEIETKTLPGMAISDYKPSNIDGCYCENPDFDLVVNGLQRSGTTVTLSFTITNKSGRIIDMHFSDWVAYDENGTTFKTPSSPMRGLDMKMWNKKLWGSDIFKFVPGASAPFDLMITDVPQSVKNFSLMRIPLIEQGRFGSDIFANPYIIIKNMNITAAPVSSTVTPRTTARKTTVKRTSTTYRKKTRR